MNPRGMQSLLTTDAGGEPTARHLVVASRDWDEIKLWSDEVYMPYTVTPTGKARQPDSMLYAAAVGGFTLSRFHYQLPIEVRDFSREAGMGMVMTGLRGGVRHWDAHSGHTETGVAEAFLVDTSRVEYRGDFNHEHLQLNLIYPHQLLADLYERWHGEPADDALWQQTAKFGGEGSSWISLLEYCGRCVTELPEQTAAGPLGRHLEEQLGLHLLAVWKQRLQKVRPLRSPRALGAAGVARVEAHICENAASAPTLSALARVAGCSAPVLVESFLRLRQIAPMDFLAEQRMLGVRRALVAAGVGESVISVSRQWGYSSVMMFSAAYHRRFGEWPSQALRQRT